MKVVEKYLGRELSTKDYMLMILLVFVFLIGLKLLVKAVQTTPQSLIESKSNRIIANNNPVRGTCAVGFYFFENESYALCYPDALTPFTTPNAANPLDITFDDSNGNQRLVVIPQYRKESRDIYDSCLIKEISYVSGKELIREKRRVNNKENCEDILSISTTIQTEKLPFWMSYQNSGDKEEAIFVTQYTEIENSLQMK